MRNRCGSFHATELSRCAGLVRGIKLGHKLRVLHHAVVNVTREAAVAQHQTFLDLARAGLREAIAFTNLNADHAAAVVTENALDIAARTHGYAHLLELLKFLANDAGARTVLRENVARNAVTAFLPDDFEIVFNAEFLDCPFVVGQSTLGDKLHLLGLVHIETGSEHVESEQFRRILDAVLELLRATGSRQNAAVDDGVATCRRHLFQNDRVGACLLGFNGSGKTGKTGTDHDNVMRFVPFCGDFGGSLSGRSKQSGNACSDGTFDQGTAIKIQLFCFSPLSVRLSDVKSLRLGVLRAHPDFMYQKRRNVVSSFMRIFRMT